MHFQGLDGISTNGGWLDGVRRGWRWKRMAGKCSTRPHAPACEFVAGSQPMNAIAFVIDGLYYGVSDFGYAAYSMVLVALISSVFLLLAAPVCGLAGVWTGLFLFMTLRVVAGIWRLSTKSGPWKMIWSKSEMEQESD
ncbi:Protein detoxification 44, chloroplastic [Vitis vinifera]|uniref:Protein detoxification 44, chloroplastic n=1 Tax=Vitis vinifera TaxID=29760 RepID=A0A438FTA7_VITVI|nr:Protein detoxification 44, chloroplastic [Vitis vinifera]RVW73803.1 Protein detoxification 44, chloroplastic [Vitis vinifera]